MVITHVFIDTNVALHFQRPDQVDWKKLITSEAVVLVAAPILLSELEKQKIHNPSGKLKERADAFTRWLIEFVRNPSIEVRPGVRWHFISSEPLIDFRDARLSRDVADDQLIASVLEYSPDDGGTVCVATDDIGLEVKLRSRKITSISLPDDLRLPVEQDPQEKELQGLRRQLAQRRAPILVLAWDDGATHRNIDVPSTITEPSAPSLAQIRSQYPFLAKRGEVIVNEKDPLAGFIKIMAQVQKTLVSPESIDRYNRELKTFFSDYETYLARLLEWEKAQSLTTPLRLALTNQGNAPASQIDVMLAFPDDILLLGNDYLSKQPGAPKEPAEPGTLAELISPHLSRPLSHSYLQPKIFKPPLLAREGTPSFDGGDHKVSFKISSLKHLFKFTFVGVNFSFPSREAMRSFHVQYHVSAVELPDAITGTLHIVLADTVPTAGPAP